VHGSVRNKNAAIKRESYGIGRGTPSLMRPLYMVGRGNAKGTGVAGSGTGELWGVGPWTSDLGKKNANFKTGRANVSVPTGVSEHLGRTP